MEPIIVAKNVTKIYKTGRTRFHALDAISLSIDPGEFVAIVGTSGSGKSTLLYVLAGLDRPSAGKIIIKNRAVHRMTEQQLVDFRLHHVGVVFQAFHLMPTLTAQENAAFSLACKGVPRKERMQKAAALLEKLGLGEHLDHKPSELSGGQQQRVSIARAMITEPAILFADEPTGNLDSKTSEDVMHILKELSSASGTTMVLVTHDMAHAKFADRQICLADGNVVED